MKDKKTYFICSDIHGFYHEFISALKTAKFKEDNPNHILVVCGDIFDRGEHSKEVYEYLKALPRERRILIRGNHEYLLAECLKKDFPNSYDFSNGTVGTICQFTDAEERWLKYPGMAILENINSLDYWQEIKNLAEYTLKPIIDWIMSDEWCNYFETDKYIMTHAFIPLGINVSKYPMAQEYLYYGSTYGMPTEYFQYRDDWRNATAEEFYDSTWGCPWKLAKQGLNQTGKTIICGHWHTSDFFNNLKFNGDKVYVASDNPIFKSKKYQLIGLDTCTALSHKVNVLVLNEDKL